MYIRRDEDVLFHAGPSRDRRYHLRQGVRGKSGKSSLLARGLEQAGRRGAKWSLPISRRSSQLGKQDLESVLLDAGKRHRRPVGILKFTHGRMVSVAGSRGQFERFFRREAFAGFVDGRMWAIDEADAIFDCDFRSSVFGLFRSWYNAKVFNSE